MVARAICVGLIVAAVSLGRCSAQDSSFTVQDAIEMTYFSDPNQYYENAVPKYSPNDRHFVVLTTRGRVQSNEVTSTIWIFDTDAVTRWVTGQSANKGPRTLVTLRAVPVPPIVTGGDVNEPLISGMRWSSDSRSILFLRQDSKGERHVYGAQIDTEKTEQLSQSGYDVREFDSSMGSIVYTATSVRDGAHGLLSQQSENPDKYVRVVTDIPLEEILFSSQGDRNERKSSELRVINGSTDRLLMEYSDPRYAERDPGVRKLFIAPNGQDVVLRLPVASVPKSWEEYAAPRGFEQRQILASQSEEAILASSGKRREQYSILDVRSGKIRFTIDAPEASGFGYDDASKAVWGADSERVLITSTFLPLDGVPAPERARRRRACAVAAVDLSSNDVQCIVVSDEEDVETMTAGRSFVLDDVSFGTDENEVIVRQVTYPPDAKYRTRTYHYVNRAWVLVDTVEAQTEGEQIRRASNSYPRITVSIKQALNDPPVLWGKDSKSGKEREIWNPNPQLEHTRFGKASVYHWKDESGFEWTAGLIKPVGYSPGRRYPLVIQTHGFWDGRFITDGTYSTAYAARPLASAGFVVLQVGTNSAHRLELQMASDQVRGYQAAIKQLSSEGLIDPTKVGIIGFSSNSWYVETALAKEPELFAAATIADGVDRSYMQRMLFGDGDGLDEHIHGQPLGVNLANYMSRSISSNLDKVKTPLRIEAIAPTSVLEEWELFSSLKMQNKPVELIYFPDGQHVLQKPRERLASQQGNVDWFRFWLQGYEDLTPQKSQQYARWRRLREVRNSQMDFSK